MRPLNRGRRLLAPVGELVKGATEIAEGNIGYRMPLAGKDEIGKLSAAFNRMGEEVQKRDAEIRTWNRDLQDRVDEQTEVLESIQDQLLHSHKIAAVTSLGAGVAHEINNPLTAVLGLTQILLSSTDKDAVLEKQRPVLENIEKEALRIKRIVGALQSFAGSYAGEGFSTFDITQLIEETVKFEEKMFEESHIALVTDFKPGLQKMHGNQTQLRQVFLELFKNARTAMPGGGKITITASMIGDRVIELVFADTGKGISREHIDRVFEPFFTTKDDWRSEGLGLTMVFHTVEEHHGTIRVESAPGKGTAITITFPADQGGAHIV